MNPEIVQFPDPGNVGVLAEPPSGQREDPGLNKYLDGSAERDYFHGEPLPEER